MLTIPNLSHMKDGIEPVLTFNYFIAMRLKEG